MPSRSCARWSLQALAAVSGLASLAIAFHDKYDVSRAPFDVRIVKGFVGYWRLSHVKGITQHRAYPPPDVVDIGLHPVPKFGARALNATFHWFDKGHPPAYRTDYGYLPVKNASRLDPRWHTALLTTSSDGFAILEQGLILKGPQIRTHLKEYVKRSFGVGGDKENLRIDALERLFDLQSSRRMRMTLQADSNWGSEDYTAHYDRVLPR